MQHSRWTFLPPAARWVTRSASVLLMMAAPAWAQVQFPPQPQSVAECEAAAERGRHGARMEQQQGENLSRQRDAFQVPRECFGNDHCRNNYYRQKQIFNQQIGEHWRRRDAIHREVDIGLRACRQTAMAAERQREEEKRMAQERQREFERQQREAQRDAAERQREQLQQQREAQQRQAELQRQRQDQQADFMRRQAEIAAMMSDQLRRQQQAQLERANRSSANPERNEPRVIGSLPPSPYAPEQRNVPRAVYTPDQQEHARLAAEQARQEQQRQQGQAEAQVLQYLARQAWASAKGSVLPPSNRALARGMGIGLKEGAEARSDLLDGSFNPQGDRYAEIDERVKAADRLQRELNARRGITPVAGQMSGDAYAGIGAMQRRTMGDADRMFSLIDSMGPTSPWPAAPPSAPIVLPPASEPPPAPPPEPAPPSYRSLAECRSLTGAQQKACMEQVCTTLAGVGQPMCAPYRAR
jgi:hypothetical protein